MPQALPAWLDYFFRRMDEALEWSLPDAERNYISCELDRILNESSREHAEKLAGVVTENLLVRISEELQRKYYLDNVLRQGLQEHLIHLIRGGDRRRAADEAALQAVVRQNAKLYAGILSCIRQIKGLRLGGSEETESALLALHFCASDERRVMTRHTEFKALVVCANGIGTSRIVSATVGKHFPQIRILATASLHSVSAIIELEKPDFILSTVPFTSRNTPVIQVGTLPTEADLARIRAFITANRKLASEVESRDIFREIWNLIERNCEIHSRNALESGLNSVLGLEPRDGQKLSELVRDEAILLDVDAEDWESAIRLSARPLVRDGCLEPRYVQAMIDNIVNMGPYIVIMPGVAMPHSLPEDGVKKSCMGIAVLRKPVKFGNEANDPVRIVLCMGARDSHEHMKEMSQLIELFSNEEALGRILAAGSRADVLDVLRTLSAGS